MSSRSKRGVPSISTDEGHELVAVRKAASGEFTDHVTQTERAPAVTQFKVSARDVRGPTEELEY